MSWLCSRAKSNWIIIVLIAYLLLLKCGDIHPNPGPPKPLSFCHLNAQSLLSGVDITRHIPAQHSKLDEIFSVLALDRDFDIIAISETWLTPCIDSDEIKLEGYQLPFRQTE